MKWGVSFAVLLTAAVALYLYEKKCREADEEGCKIIYEHPQNDPQEESEKFL